MTSRLCLVFLLLTRACASEIPTTAESCTANDGSECVHDDMNALLQSKVDTSKKSELSQADFDMMTKNDDDASLRVGWDVRVPDYESSMSITTQVLIDNELQFEGTLAAFIGNKCRGVQPAPNIAPFGPHKGKPFYALMIHGHSKDQVESSKITFKFMKKDGSIVNLDEDRYSWVNDATHGNIMYNILVMKGGFNYRVSDFPDSMSITAQVTIEGKLQATGALAALSGNAVRGVQGAPQSPPFGPKKGQAMFLLTIHGQGAAVPLVLMFRDSKGVVHKLQNTLQWKTDDTQGSALAPVALFATATTTTTTTITTCVDDDAGCTAATQKNWNIALSCAQLNAYQFCVGGRTFMTKYCSKTCSFC